MKNRSRVRAAALLAVVLSNAGVGLAQKGAPAVTGTGTPGRVAKFTAASSVGDSVITENKFGQVGVGTDAPSSRLTVFGRVESLTGGFKFPDGTTQTSAGLTAGEVVTSFNGLRGDVQIAGSENVIVTPSGNTVALSVAGLLTPDQAVTSVNGIRGDIVLTAGPNITLTPSGNTVVIAAEPGAATSVITDATLAGDGSGAAPLRVSVPLSLEGGGPTGSVLIVRNVGGSGELASGATIIAGESSVGLGGAGVNSQGGGTGIGDGGPGIFAAGGFGTGNEHLGGSGIVASGGVGLSQAGPGFSGEFFGDVQVTGNLDVSGATTRAMDNPLDPENKLLRHAAVESSEMLNVYSGNVVTDARGQAVVALPDWFEAVNADLRYQLTVVGTFARAIVAEKMANNRFTIKTDAPNVEVSWQVTGVRADAASKRSAFEAVVEKPARERGLYRVPEAFGQPAERGIFQTRNGKALQSAKHTGVEF